MERREPKLVEFDVALVTVVQPNVTPVVDAGDDGFGLKNTPIALDGTVFDPDNTPAIQWESDSPTCVFANPSAVDTTITCSSTGIFAALLTADDGVNPPVSDVGTRATTTLKPRRFVVDHAA